MSDASPMGVVLGDDHYQTHRIAQSLLDKEADIELVA